MNSPPAYARHVPGGTGPGADGHQATSVPIPVRSPPEIAIDVVADPNTAARRCEGRIGRRALAAGESQDGRGGWPSCGPTRIELCSNSYAPRPAKRPHQ